MFGPWLPRPSRQPLSIYRECLSIQLDIRVMIRGYQKFQIGLVKGGSGFVGSLYRLEGRSLYMPVFKYVELGAFWHYVRSHGRVWTDRSYENVSFCIRDLRLLRRGYFRGFSAAVRLRPFPRCFWTRVFAESLTCFAMMWRGSTSLDVLSAMSDRILPPFRNVSRPTALTPLQRTGRTSRNIPLKMRPIPCPRCMKGGTE